MNLRVLFVLAIYGAACSAQQCISSPCSTSANYAYDLIGVQDTRPNTWGAQGWQAKPIVFEPPAGYATRVLRVHLNMITWGRGTPAQDAPAPGDGMGHAAGTLIALCSTGSGGAVAPPGNSTQVKGGGAADNCFSMEQLPTKGEPEHLDVDLDTHVGGLLMSDNTMNVTGAVWLNTLQLAVHLEASLTIIFQYEPVSGQ